MNILFVLALIAIASILLFNIWQIRAFSKRKREAEKTLKDLLGREAKIGEALKA